MSALPPDQTRSMRKLAKRGSRSSEALAQRWKELHEQSAQLASLAAIVPEPFGHVLADFPNRFEAASDWQRDLVWQAIEDIDAMMQPGMTALRTIAARDQDATAPALALWREFFSARNAVLALVEPNEIQQTANAA
ncbi:MAG: hypothetical protein AAGE86_02125 [Pseudomonadota bacterium]